MEQFLIDALTQYGYIILFVWSVMEGELGLVMAGTMVHTGHMNMPMAIFVAGLGGFAGDQLYFYIGRSNKKWLYRYLKKHHRKFALAHLLLKKYGWPVIFIQRYLYGLRTIIPMSIGLTRYSARKFAIINFLSAQVWAAVTIVLAYIFGEQILAVLEYTKHHWYFALPVAALIFGTIGYTFKRIEDNILHRRSVRHANRNKSAEAA
ncbi:DedA family protein [Hydrogenimonas urashimensis]|uniref:DedA family protein n=1 Tax=Hydrogenimonas urashimensis TaxID=2740515 RepID=UPI0019169D0F|nr:DedA family protein [Hydrogenimonas urashimensis]